MKRTLALKREILTELSTEELVGVAGGTTPVSRTCALWTFAPCVLIQTVTYTVQTALNDCLG